MRCISTLTDFDEGTISISGHDIRRDHMAAKNCMGVIQQQISLDKDLTIRENMISHAMYHMIRRDERDARIAELSDYFGLGEYLDKPVDSLSGGWKKRAAIICAMLHDPEVLFLDEPTTGLDINARRLLWDIVRSLQKRGTTVFLTTHYIEEAEALCDRVGIIDHGRLIALDVARVLCDSVGSITVEYLEDGKTTYRHFKNRQNAQEFASRLETDSDIRIRRTSLEDVFVELTGRSAEVLG